MGLLIVYMQRRKLSLCTFEVAVDDMFPALPQRALSVEEIVLHAIPDGAGLIYPVVTAGTAVSRADLEDVAATLNSILVTFDAELYMTPLQLLNVISLLPGHIESTEDISKFVLPDPEASTRTTRTFCTQNEALAVLSQHADLQSISEAVAELQRQGDETFPSTQAFEGAVEKYKHHDDISHSGRPLKPRRKQQGDKRLPGEFSIRAITAVRASYRKLMQDCTSMTARLRLLRESVADLTLLMLDVVQGTEELAEIPVAPAGFPLPCQTIEDLENLEKKLHLPKVKSQVQRALTFATQGVSLPVFHKMALRSLMSDAVLANYYVSAVHGYPCPYDQARRQSLPKSLLQNYRKECEDRLPETMTTEETSNFWFSMFAAIESNFRRMKKLKRAAQAMK